jgi:hypothetical protein
VEQGWAAAQSGGSLTLNLRCQAIAGTDGLLLAHGTKETFVAN